MGESEPDLDLLNPPMLTKSSPKGETSKTNPPNYPNHQHITHAAQRLRRFRASFKISADAIESPGENSGLGASHSSS